jgi:RNA polymerase sigma-70 factor, ECF subfamily
VTTGLPTPPLGHAPAAGRSTAVPTPTFEQIFHDEAAYVGRALRYLGVPEAHLEDACQETFVVVHRQLGQLRGGSTRAWVRQICILVAQNHRRARRRRPEDTVAALPEVAVPATQHDEAERRQVRDRLLLALDALPEDQRSVFVLYEIEQLTMPEIAAAIGCALQTAYSRLHAARGKVQAAMKGTAP